MFHNFRKEIIMDKFSSRHFAFFILGTTIVSLKTYPGVFLRNGGRDSWIAMIIASAIIFIIYLYIISASEQGGRPDMTYVYQTALGKAFGNIFIFLFIVVLFITLVECSAVEADSMHENMMIETPNWFLILFFVIPSIYAIRKDIVAVFTVVMIGIVLIVFAGINLAILTAGYKDFHRLLPIFGNGITVNFFVCIMKILGLYGCAFITLPYLSKIIDSKRNMKKSVIVGIIVVIQMQIVSATGMIMTFVPSALNSMNYPKLLQTQLISYMQFLEFGELYVMLQILGGWLLKYLITFYAIFVILDNLKVNKKVISYSLYVLSAFVYAGAYFASKNLYMLFKLLNYYSYLCLLNFIIIPLIVYTIFLKKNKAS